MGRGIGLVACAGIGTLASGPGVIIIASGFPVTTDRGTFVIGRPLWHSVEENVTGVPRGGYRAARQPFSGCPLHGSDVTMERLPDRNPQLFFFL